MLAHGLLLKDLLVGMIATASPAQTWGVFSLLLVAADYLFVGSLLAFIGVSQVKMFVSNRGTLRGHLEIVAAAG